MFGTLLKKQFMESFRSYFINAKTGKGRSTGSTVAMFVLFGVLMMFMAFVFFGMGVLLGELIESGYSWLFYSLIGTISVALGVFGSVFNTFSVLYQAKDNDLLLSMPIPPRMILGTRMSLVFGLSLLYSGIVWVPAVASAWAFHSVSVSAVIFQILLFPIISLFVTVLTCALGWLVALISSKLKNKSLFTVLLTLVFMGVYYFVCFRMSDIMTLIMNNSEAVGGKIKAWGNVIYLLGRAADGNALFMLAFTGITAVLFALCFCILSKSFTKIVTVSEKTKKQTKRAVSAKKQSIGLALFKREWKRFISIPLYLLNCGLGAFVLPLAAIVGVVKRDSLQYACGEIGEIFPSLSGLVPLMVLFAVFMVLSIDTISTPSVSLEGKTLWLIRSLPVSGADVLMAKLWTHALFNGVPGMIGTVVLLICIKADIVTCILSAVIVALFAWITGIIGLFIGLANPNFTWANESTPIKQSINVIFSWFAGIGVAILFAVGAVLAAPFAGNRIFLASVVLVFLIAAYFLTLLLRKKGGKIFDKL